MPNFTLLEDTVKINGTPIVDIYIHNKRSSFFGPMKYNAWKDIN